MEQLKPLIDQLVEIIKGTKEFTLAQCPEFARQYLIKSTIEGIMFLIGSFIALAISVYWWRWTYVNWDSLHDEVAFFLCFGVVVGTIFSSIFVIASINDLLVIWLAPKVWIVENIVDSISSK